MTTTRGMTVDELLALPMLPRRLDVDPAFGISTSAGKALARAGRYPVPIVKVGKTQRVRRTDVLAFLGVTDAEQPVGA